MSDELSYELAVRGCTTGRTVDEKRHLLREVLHQEKHGNASTCTVNVDPQKEFVICSAKLDELLGYIEEFDFANGENEYRRISARLGHVSGRLHRIDTDLQPSAMEMKTELQKSLEQLGMRLEETYRNGRIDAQSNLMDQPNEESRRSILDEPNDLLPEISGAQRPSFREEAHIEPTTSRSPASASRHVAWASSPQSFRPENCQARDGVASITDRLRYMNFSNHWLDSSRDTDRVVMLSKWNVTFDGTSSVLTFLERLEEMRQSRGATKPQLLRGAAELFSGDALLWYRSIRHRITHWEDLVTCLKESFLPHDYEESLWSEIRGRTQHPQERVVLYVAIMENLFNRLPNKATEDTKIAIIKRNLQPEYMPHLALQNIKTVEQLIDVCRKLENAKVMASRYKSPPTSSTHMVEPELSATKCRARFSAMHAVEAYERGTGGLGSLDAARGQLPEPSSKSAPPPALAAFSCWNCSQQGHGYQRCPRPRRMFCFGCGQPGHTKRNCPACSGNANPSH